MNRKLRAELERLASTSHTSSFMRSATSGPWYCECPEPLPGPYGSCSRCHRKPRRPQSPDATGNGKRPARLRGPARGAARD